MCKQLADILFPLNILGRRVRFITYDTPFRPGSTPPTLDLNIEFEGKSFELSYVRYQVVVHTFWETPIKEIRNGDFAETITVAAGRRGGYYCPKEQKVYIKCVGSTKLIINGEQII